MATRQQLETALRNADKAGDAQAAKALASAIRGGQFDVEESTPLPDTQKSLAAWDEAGVDFDSQKAMGNVPSSGARFIQNTANAITSPIDTISALGAMLAGGAQKVGDMFPSFETPVEPTLQGIPMSDLGVTSTTEQDYRPAVEQMGQFLKDRYGSWGDIKYTAQTDPVGSVADVAALLTGVGGGLKAAGNMGRVGSGMQKVGAAIDPLNMALTGTKAVGKGASNLYSNTAPTRLYESAAKFSTTFDDAKRAKLADTALSNRLMPTTKGLDKLRSLKTELGSKIDSLIKEATDSGKAVPKKAVYRYLQDLRKKMSGNADSRKNIRQINRVAKEWDLENKRLGRDSLTPDELQKFKKDTYDSIDWGDKNRTGTNKAKREMARAAKESIEEVAPVKDLNRQLGDLLELEQPLARSTARIENLNQIPIDAPIKMGAGGAAAGTPGAVAGTALSIWDLPKVKAWTAIKMRQLKDMGYSDVVAQNMVRTMVQQGMFQAGRSGEVIE